MKELKAKKIASVFSIFIGIAMIGMWIMFYATGNIPELATEPMRISMHILAEVITAIMLIIAGVGIFAGIKWAREVYFLSMGMLIYTLIQSPGYFMETEDYGFVIMFGIMLALAILMIIKMVPLKKV